ncbi:restriction endonuclease [Noviherbaspirillum sp. CPCC 100848]|uniref:Restriction endonuclease n=1 Tax=Noviherbaspirillum album TaxID=3080276 RepID=A0ABU6JJ51_9BURK|nr:restriction endonuclease [Noviherbaspirillum sp. CPCC 100848]MEC4723295.1 restriction endonuclease [Noviherbaspirillum sp. CPCC 100848]
MGRKRKSSPAEDLLDLISMLPWWGGVALAIVSYLVLRRLAAPVPMMQTQPGQIGQMVSGIFKQTLAYYGQFILPTLCLIGAAISAFKRNQRSNLIADVSASSAVNVLEGMTWREFEMLVGEAFRLQGYQVVETGGNGADGGVDLVLRKDNEKFYVQCKQWKAYKVGVEVVREMYGVMAAHGATGGFVVTSGRFTDAASQFALGRNLKLVDGPALMKLIEHAKSNRTAAVKTDVNVKTPMKTKLTAPSRPHCAETMVQRSAKRGAHAGQSFWGRVAYPSCKGIRPFA